MTCTRDQHEHAVPDTEMQRAHDENHGVYRALCGRQVVPGSLAAPPGQPCAGCRRLLTTGHPAGRTRSGRVGGRWHLRRGPGHPPAVISHH